MSSYDETEFKKILHTVCDRNVEILITSVSNLKFETLKKKKVDILVVILNSTLGAYNLIVINNKKKVIDVHNSRGSKIISIKTALKKVFSKNEYIFNIRVAIAPHGLDALFITHAAEKYAHGENISSHLDIERIA